MLKKTLVLILVGVCVFNNGFAYPADLLSLDPLIAEARKNNPDILAAKKRWEASKTRIPQAKSLEDPSIGFVRLCF